MLIVTGTISVTPSDLANMMADLEALAKATRRHDGNLFYHTAVLNVDTGQLLVVERWRDEAALTAHLQATDTSAFMARWQGRVEGDVRMYDASNERPLVAG